MKFDAGRVIAYAGGSGVSYTSQSAKASAAGVDVMPTPGDVVSLLNMPLVEMGGVHVVMADAVSVGGLLFVGARLAFDIWKHFDNRRGGGDAK
ncbi:hypothetical protein [Stutzerimonas xanthomarina]|uniref:hypothetical protein n=1 Tax=Stutzerimonas xanthomarina TaxID=271420 RepID=UPI003AA8E30E